MIRNFLFLFSFVIISCNNNASDESKTVWIGGEIINPKTDYVVFYKDESVIDTVKLDENNFFLYKNEELQEGIYSFKHNEFQLFYIEPGDSLMLRVNTVDFDESLTYTGKGAINNNFLMELFLLNEFENRLVHRWYTLPPKGFEKKIDSLKKIRDHLFDEFDALHHPNKGLKKVVRANIDFDYFSKKEMYTSANLAKNIPVSIDQFPKRFYDYRKNIDFGIEELRSYYPYYRFLNRYIDNLAFQNYKDNQHLNKYSYDHCNEKLKIIDSLVTNDALKNHLLRTSTMRYLLHASSVEEQDKILGLFLSLDSDKNHQKEVQHLANATKKLTVGNSSPNVAIIGTDNIVKELHQCIKRPSVLYFWSSQSIKHYKDIHSKAAELRSKFPEYDYIGINTDTNFKKWRNIVLNSGYNQDLEFQLENIDEAEQELVINSINKAIIISKDGVIIESNTNLFSKSIEGLLLGYLN